MYYYYKPDLGRFLNEDPIGLSCSKNLFNFVNNNPINGIDPMGLFCIPLPSEKSGWDFEKYKNSRENIKLTKLSFSPQGTALCLWEV